MAYGPGESRFVEEKRHKEKPIPISDLVLLDRERCILCDRCTRFAKDVAGDPLIHFINRGNDTEINTFPDEPFSSYFSGNTVQICPVGALTATQLPLPGPAVGPRAGRVAPARGARSAAGSRSSRPATRCCATRASTSTRSTGAGCATRAASASRRSTATSALGAAAGPPGRRARPRRRWADALGRGGRRRRGPRPRRPPSAVLGGARLTNEAAYAWAKLAKGVHRHRQRRRPARRRPAGRGRARACPGPPSTRCARRAAPSSCSGPDLKEELPVLFLRLRHAVGQRRREGRRDQPAGRRASRPTPPCRCIPGPGEAGATARALLDGTAARHRRRRGRRRGAGAAPPSWSAPVRSPSSSAASRWPSRPTRVVDAAGALLAAQARHPLPAGAAPGQRARRARHGPGPRAAARPGHARRGPRLLRRPLAARCRPTRGLDAARHPGRRRRRPHRRAGPAGRRPARRLPRPRPRRAGPWPAPAP